MQKLPPIEKIPEAYTAIIDKRAEINDNIALVKSSDNKKVYTIKWHNNIYYSNDNSTYWQNYPGYPVIAVLMLQEKLPFDETIASYFANVNWHELNEKNKRNYQASVHQILSSISETEQKKVYDEIDKVYNVLKSLDITLTKKQNISIEE